MVAVDPMTTVCFLFETREFYLHINTELRINLRYILYFDDAILLLWNIPEKFEL